jgi:hypothetical protein
MELASTAAASTNAQSALSRVDRVGAFLSPLMLLGTMSAAYMQHDVRSDLVECVTRALQPTLYWQESLAPSVFGLTNQGSYIQVLAATGEATVQDFARFAMEVIERQTSIDPEIDARIAARLHEIFE